MAHDEESPAGQMNFTEISTKALLRRSLFGKKVGPEVVPWPEEHRVTIGYEWLQCERDNDLRKSKVTSRSNNVGLHYGVLTTTGENVSQSEGAIGQVTRLKSEADVQTAEQAERLGPSSVPSLPTVIARWTLGI